jgi:hypothetical protein
MHGQTQIKFRSIGRVSDTRIEGCFLCQYWFHRYRHKKMTGYSDSLFNNDLLVVGYVRPVTSVLHLSPCYFTTGDQSAHLCLCRLTLWTPDQMFLFKSLNKHSLDYPGASFCQCHETLPFSAVRKQEIIRSKLLSMRIRNPCRNMV